MEIVILIWRLNVKENRWIGVVRDDERRENPKTILRTRNSNVAAIRLVRL